MCTELLTDDRAAAQRLLTEQLDRDYAMVTIARQGGSVLIRIYDQEESLAESATS